jgi:predicted  nucleic acid-binding Zn-ribbon protein
MTTEAATAARRQRSDQLLKNVEAAIRQIGRERGRITVREVARRAGTSSTFLYENPKARQLITAATADLAARRDRQTNDAHDAIEATWRERALNAEHALTGAQKEVLAQRQRIAEFMGQIRDLGQPASGESLLRLTDENSSLKAQLRTLSHEHRSLQERLEGARSNIRFAERRIADLEAQLLEAQRSTGV